jgi:tetratricopeptide (TPR) repeat protein
MVASEEELAELMGEMPPEKSGKATQIVAGTPTQLGDQAAMAGDEIKEVPSSGEFELGEAPAGHADQKLMGVSSGEFELGEAPRGESPSSTSGYDLVEVDDVPDIMLESPPSGAGQQSGVLPGELSTPQAAAPREPATADESGSMVDLGRSWPKGEVGSSDNQRLASDAIDLGQHIPMEDVRSSNIERLGEGMAEPTSGDVAESFLEDHAHGLLQESESSAVDLGSSRHVDPESGSMAMIHAASRERRPQMDSGLLAEASAGELAAEDEAETEQRRREVHGDREPSAAKPGNAVRWLGGGVIGAVLGAAACVALWVAGVEPPAGWRSQPQQVAKTQDQPIRPPENQAGPVDKQEKPAENQPKATDQPVQPVVPAPATREDYRVYRDRGDFAKLLEENVPDGEIRDPEQADRLAARGEAQWLIYLQNQKKNKGTLDPNADAVAKARADLQRANNASGAFALGLILESSGDLAGARQLYQGGLERFKDDPQSRQVFQTALDRLDALVEEKADTPAADKTGAMRFRMEVDRAEALLLLLVQAEPASAGQAQEAGNFFWLATKLAREQKYEQALEMLKKARDTHDARRFERLRRSQNPTSDPNEDIFLRACDELKVYWQMRQSLQKGGYLDIAKQKDPARALENALADAKAPRSTDAALQMVIDKLKKEKDVAAAEPDLKDAGKGIDLLLASKKKTDSSLKAIQDALQDAKYVSDKQPDMVKGLEALVKDKKEAGDALAAAAKVLEANKYVSADQPSISRGVERILQEKKALEDSSKSAEAQLKAAEDSSKTALSQLKTAEANYKTAANQLTIADQTLQAVAGKLAAAKVVAPDARGEALVKGIDVILQRSSGSPVATVPGKPDSNTVATMPAAYSRPEDVTVANAEEAEKHYAAGLNHFWARRYQAAERELAQAVQLAGPSGVDARYYYFLGLARLGAGNAAGAIASFRQAGDLERQNRPDRPTVTATLERVQGAPRRMLEAYGRARQ